MRRSRLLLCAITVLLALSVSGATLAQQPLTLTLTLQLRSADGQIGALLRGPDGATIALAERVDPAAVPLEPVTLAAGSADVPRLAPWSCERALRRFVATLTAPDGSTTSAHAAVRTPTCATRLSVSDPPSSVRPGAEVALRLSDSWRAGLPARVCLLAPRASARCRTVQVPAAASGTTVRWRLRAAGTWRITATARAQGARTVRRSVAVRPPAHLRLLATGDSMVQIVDSYLDQRLPGASVRSDAHISTGISKPAMFDWVAAARRQASSIRPDATVVFLGANDGFPIGAAGCCGSAWIAAYARRVATMMRAYRRDGDGRVYWLTLPPPGRASFARVFTAVNAALRKAAREVGSGVRLIDVGAAVAPGGRYQRTLSRGGRSVVVRQDDTVHLATAGASIVADLVIAALRRDGLAR